MIVTAARFCHVQDTPSVNGVDMYICQSPTQCMTPSDFCLHASVSVSCSCLFSFKFEFFLSWCLCALVFEFSLTFCLGAYDAHYLGAV